MPGLLNTMIDPSLLTSNYPNREALLSQAMSRQPQRTQIPSPVTTPPPQRPMMQSTASDVGLQSLIQDQKMKDAQGKLQAALKEIVETREKSGKKFLTPTQRLGILTKHGIPDFASKMINDAITQEQEKLEPKYHTVTRPTAEGGTTTGIETEEELRKSPVETPPTRKEKLLRQIESGEKTIESLNPLEKALLGLKDVERPYKVGQVVDGKQVTGYDKNNMPVFKSINPEKEFAAFRKDRLNWTEGMMKDWRARPENIDITPEQEESQYDLFNAQYTGAIKGWTPFRHKETGKFIFRTPDGRHVDERESPIKEIKNAPTKFGTEKDFKRWYSVWAEKTGLSADPDDSRHKYDYRAAYRAKASPARGEDGKWHWPSRFKAEDHPRRIIKGVDTKTEKPVAEKKVYEKMMLIGGNPSKIKAEREKANQELLDLADKIGVSPEDWKNAWKDYKNLAGWTWKKYNNVLRALLEGQKEARETLPGYGR